MAVPKSRVSRSRRGHHRSHHALNPVLSSIDATTGESHRRHHISKAGYYRGVLVMPPRVKIKDQKDQASAQDLEDNLFS